MRGSLNRSAFRSRRTPSMRRNEVPEGRNDIVLIETATNVVLDIMRGVLR